MRPYLIVSAPSTGVLNVCKAKDVPLLIQNEEPVRKMQKESRVPDPFPIKKIPFSHVLIMSHSKPHLLFQTLVFSPRKQRVVL